MRSGSTLPKNLSDCAAGEARGLVRIRDADGTACAWRERAELFALLEDGWLLVADQDAHDGFWAHRGEALPKLDEIIIVDTCVEIRRSTRHRSTSFASK